jgi:type IV pilus assembly protein PilV
MQRRSSQSGFSLIELLIAVFILAVGLLGLAELQITAMKANAQSETILAASNIAQQVVEEIVAMKPDDPIFAAPGFTNAAWPNTFFVEGGGTYDVKWDVAIDHSGVDGLCRVTVRVESTSALMNVLGNQKRLVTATTLKRTAGL